MIRLMDLPPAMRARILKEQYDAAPNGGGKANKYHAQRVEVDGMRFDSRKEARYYAGLKESQRLGLIRFFLRQVPFHLPGGVRYVVDFVVFQNDGRVDFIDVKGHKTPGYVTKKKIVEALYPVKIEEV